MLRHLFLVFVAVVFIPQAHGQPTVQSAGQALSDSRPNIVLIVADDMGYSDLGAYGSEIRTPNLDALAARGAQLTAYRTSPTCGPTRAMLMSGVDHHRAGLGVNAASLRRLPELRERPGYEGLLNDRVVTVARLLKDAGYETFMTGKWDLGGQPEKLPTARGFDRFMGIPSAGASHFSDAVGTFRAVEDAVYVQDGQPLDALRDDFYSSSSYTDAMLDFIAQRPDPSAPYFAYVAYTAPHWPLQVPDDWLDRYAGEYDVGWDAIRQARFERLRDLGIIPADAQLPPGHRAALAWDDVLPGQRVVELKRMEIYAAMIELMDHHIGRLVDTLSESERETVFIFVSDNGSEANDVISILDTEYWVASRFDNRLANMGRRDSYVWLGLGWGAATSTPFRLFKSYISDGGIRAPAIFHSTADRFETGLRSENVIVTDVPATILDLAGTSHPGESYDGRDVIPMMGVSALDYLTGRAPTVHGDDPLAWELYGNRALIRGTWKAMLIWPPNGSGQWSLYDLSSDPAEMNDLAAQFPERLASMIEDWEAYAEQNGIAVFDEDLGYGRYP